MKFKVGETYKYKIGGGKPYKIHIVAIVDEGQVVFKYYGRHKQWWHYEVIPQNVLAAVIERDLLVGLFKDSMRC